MCSPPFENRHSLTTAIDLDQAALRIRDLADPNKRVPCVDRVKSDDRLVASDNNFSNGDLVANGSAPVVINGNSRMSAGSSHRDISLCDNESRIPPSSPGHESKRDTIVTVDSGDTSATATGVRPCCPAFCYCESNCCDNYKESCIRRTWHGARFYVCGFVEHKYFEWFILAMIVISSLTLVSLSSVSLLSYISSINFGSWFVLSQYLVGVLFVLFRFVMWTLNLTSNYGLTVVLGTLLGMRA